MDIYQQITDSIVFAIEQGVRDVIMPWHRGGGEIPVNINSNQEYQGINIVNLWVISQIKGYNSSVWGTYKQWREVGCQVRKGEKATPIIFYKQYQPKDSEEDEKEVRRVIKSYSVFNGDQVDGYTPPELVELDPIERLEHVEQAIKATGAVISEGGTKACYRPQSDTILIPDSRRFIGDNNEKTEAYYSVLWHELGHWTGHKSRLNRDMSGRFGDENYAMEELVAELTSAFCCAELRLSLKPREDHACYIANWLEVLKKDKKAIFYASARAQDAVNFLLP